MHVGSAYYLRLVLSQHYVYLNICTSAIDNLSVRCCIRENSSRTFAGMALHLKSSKTNGNNVNS